MREVLLRADGSVLAVGKSGFICRPRRCEPWRRGPDDGGCRAGVVLRGLSCARPCDVQGCDIGYAALGS